jgi:hypothetical protein
MVLTPPLALLLGPQLAIPVVLILEAFVAAPMMRDAREARDVAHAPALH